MHRVCVLGDSLSVHGQCLRLEEGWPHKLQERLGGDWEVSTADAEEANLNGVEEGPLHAGLSDDACSQTQSF